MSDVNVIFVDDEEHLRVAATQTFDLAGLTCSCHADGQAALIEVARAHPGVLVTDLRMPGLDGTQVMRKALEIDPEFPVILVTGHGDIQMAVQSMQEGAYDFIEKPYDPARLVASVRRALDKRRLTIENRALRRRVGSADVIESRLVGRSAPMVKLRQTIRAVAATDADVLITGTTGTGKEVAARALHRASERGQRPFVHVNCAALPEALIESELFGHEAGAFPGAVRARYGKFEHARGGILCLDEIDSLPMPLQAKLLHALQNRTITRLGSNEPIDLDIRVVAISKGGLEDMVQQDQFRPDLLYRLNVVTLRILDLSERAEDIPRLFTTLVTEAAVRYKRDAPDIPGAVLSSLVARPWPGNVRELRNVADRFVLGLDLDLGADSREDPGTLAEMIAAHEKSLIGAAIAAHGGRLKDTYEALGLSRKTLYEKMQKHGLSRQDFAEEP
ncbi:MAG: sigma-54 dependent transcriptional regulator [Pseudomonadota bacterium]